MRASAWARDELSIDESSRAQEFLQEVSIQFFVVVKFLFNKITHFE